MAMIEEYYLFTDESGKNSYSQIKQNRNSLQYVPNLNKSIPSIFTFAGVLIEESHLEQQLIPFMKTFKMQSYNKSDIILHRSSMLARKDGFEHYYKNNNQKLSKDMDAIADIIKRTDMKIIPISVDKPKMLNRYGDNNSSDPYKFAVQLTMERIAGYFQYKSGIVIHWWSESRSPQEDQILNKFKDILLDSKNEPIFLNVIFKQPVYQSSLKNIRKIEWKGIRFLPKELRPTDKNYIAKHVPSRIGTELCNGLQMADLIVSTIRQYNESIIYPQTSKPVCPYTQKILLESKNKILPYIPITNTIGVVVP